MKAFILATTAVLLTATAPASASIITVGGSFAESCYHSAVARAKTVEALATCDQALAEQALTARDQMATHVNRGILRMIKGENAGAQADFDRALTIDPNEPEIWLNMGVLHFQQGDSDGAVRMFERAIALRTKAPALAYFGRGLANEDRGNLRAAYADLTRARELRPDWSEPARELARYRVRRN